MATASAEVSRMGDSRGSAEFTGSSKTDENSLFTQGGMQVSEFFSAAALQLPLAPMRLRLSQGIGLAA